VRAVETTPGTNVVVSHGVYVFSILGGCPRHETLRWQVATHAREFGRGGAKNVAGQVFVGLVRVLEETHGLTTPARVVMGMHNAITAGQRW
jgi:hypothetical protein